MFTTLSETVGEPYQLLLPIALILLFAKLLALGLKKIHLPEVIGFLVAGLLLGALTFIPGQTIFTDYTLEGINDLAKIGVILLMFSAGLETDLKKIKSVGAASAVITSLGVIVPMALGFGVAFAFMPNNDIFSNLFYGVILTATSVSITVATLKEMGKLDTDVGSAIISAAILDDVIGIILLSLIITLSGGDSGKTYVDNAGLNIFITVLLMIAFFVLAVLIGFVIRKLFAFLDNKYPHHRRLPIFSFVICFLFAYCAEAFFNVADITGAYVAGLILSSTKSKQYIDHRTETTSALFFTPIFFASIALKMYTGNVDFSDSTFIWFGLCWVIVGLLGKIIGAGIGAKLTHFSVKESTMVGVGMMARAEVVIVSAQKGVDSGLVNQAIMPFTLILIIISSFLTPILLKILGKTDSVTSPAFGPEETPNLVVKEAKPQEKAVENITAAKEATKTTTTTTTK